MYTLNDYLMAPKTGLLAPTTTKLQELTMEAVRMVMTGDHLGYSADEVLAACMMAIHQRLELIEERLSANGEG